MRARFTVAVLALLTCFVAVTFQVRAQDNPASTPTSNHPLVGAWMVTIDISMNGAWDALFLFHDDGTVIATDEQGQTWYGAWVPTGARSATYTLVMAGPADASATFFGTADVEPSGNTWVRSTRLTVGGDSIRGTRITAE